MPSLLGGHSLPNISQTMDSSSSRHRIDPFEQGWKNCSCLVFGSSGCLFAFGCLSVESRSRSFQPCFRGWSKNTERLKFVKSRYTCTVVPYWMDFRHKLHDIDLIKLNLWSILRNVCILIVTNISSGQSILELIYKKYPFYPKEPFSPKFKKKIKSVSVLEDSLNLEKNKIAKINFIFQE